MNKEMEMIWGHIMNNPCLSGGVLYGLMPMGYKRSQGSFIKVLRDMVEIGVIVRERRISGMVREYIYNVVNMCVNTEQIPSPSPSPSIDGECDNLEYRIAKLLEINEGLIKERANAEKREYVALGRASDAEKHRDDLKVAIVQCSGELDKSKLDIRQYQEELDKSKLDIMGYQEVVAKLSVGHGVIKRYAVISKGIDMMVSYGDALMVADGCGEPCYIVGILAESEMKLVWC